MKLTDAQKKTLLFLAMVLYFSVGYLLVNYISSKMQSGSLATVWDASLPFTPIFIVIYLIGYPLPALPHFIIKDLKTYKRAVMAYFFILTVSFLVFLVFPIHVMRPHPNAMSDFYATVFGWLQTIDGPYNAFPSLHVSMATIACLACFDWHKRHAWLLVWPVLIAVSAVLVKQHYIWDVIGGLSLGVAAYFIFLNPKTRLVHSRHD